MAKCPGCRRKKSVLLNCKGCDKSFCTGCIPLELHTCTGLETLKEAKLQELEKKLMDAKAPLRPKIEM